MCINAVNQSVVTGQFQAVNLTSKFIMNKLIVVLAVAVVNFAVQAKDRPNILLILADDLGYADVSFNVAGKAEIPTPNLDKLAKAGTIFTSAYVVHPFCGPSRMGLLSGRYPHEFGGPFNLPESSSGDYRNQGIPASETLISSVLQRAGYFTGAMGKWHLGQQPEHHPNRRGFDEFYGFLGGGHDYFGPFKRQSAAGNVNDYKLHPEHNGVSDTMLTAKDYMTDVLTEKGINFLNTAATNQRPFFLYMAYNAPHTPLQAKPEDEALFPNLTGKRKTYAAMVHALDQGVGKIVAALKANGQFDNTLIIFLSDNGGRTDQGGVNAPLQGRKGDVWEGGFRVPMFWHWPDGLAGGKHYDDPVTALDFYPTFAHLASAAIPAGKVIEGKDISDSVAHAQNAHAGQPIYAVRYNIGFGKEGSSQVGIRQDQWKATRTAGQNWKLYNITNDIGETTDVAAQHPEVLKEMVSKAKSWSGKHVTPLWYDDAQAGQDWTNRAMPHYSETFSLP